VGILPDSGLFVLISLGRIEGRGAEKSADLILQFGDLVLFKGVREHLACEQHHVLVEILVLLLVRQNLGLELHKRSAVAVRHAT